ncbi:Gag-Pol polyprotein [Folsomia candida]|uniref:Gag-Pol polyprotein n=2 Tax=Folsomia candida TaxID=158441 RepID=A0A226DIJ1_FOLCA|nr:Gag-Pol polyprotein [Folsomia candida]
MDPTIRRVSHGWESGLLWRDEDVKLPCNKNYAFQRLKSMEKKMDQDPEFARQYVERIQEYQEKGFAKILPPEKAAIETSRTFYLPHFMAYNAKKPKKYRFVFDAAAKVYGRSLNDHLLQGPDKLVSLPGALLKFRQRRIGVTGDIKDMFHRIKIREEDACAQRFLWRGMDRDRDPDVMKMGVLIFGASCSPACAQEAKNKNAEQFKEEFPDAYKAIVHRHYMDDLLDSYDTEAQAIQMQKDIFEVHRRGSFHICNWLSNNPEVMNAIPAELQSKTSESLDINKEDQIERVLGLFWMPEEDNFTFCLKYLKVSEEVMKGRRIPTKREILSLVMSVFDPLGFLSTLTIKAKMILQRTWISEIGWDDEIPSSTHQAWKLWLTLLESITEFKVPRCYCPTFSRSTDNQLHIFGDGSEEAFGVVAYFRIAHGSQVTTALVMAKANVAPIKHLTIPRMELQAAVIAARLAKFIQDHHDVDIHKTVFWSDSQTVLNWIRADGKRYQQFVASRIGEIHELTDASQWRWISTKENPADELTRMSSHCDWTSQSRWINGPEFLKLEENLWPTQKRTSKNEMTAEAELELKKEQILRIEEKRKCSLDASNISSWTRLIRVTAYILRFIAKIRKVPSRTGALFPSELRGAQMYWNRVAQMESFPDEVAALKNGTSLPSKNMLTGLSVKLDDGLLRIAGRLENANLPFRQRRPIILSRHHPYVKLLVQYFHEICGHHGQERICNEIRQQYHVIGLRTAVRAAQSRCQSCKNRRAVPIPPEMGQLPKFRVENPGYPFNMTGLDYFGPIQVTVKRSTEKRYVALLCLCLLACVAKSQDKVVCKLGPLF